MSNLRIRASGERGASLVEYALLLALIAVVCIAAVGFLGRSGSGKLNGAGEGLTGSAGAACSASGDSHWFTYADGSSSGYIFGPCP